MVDPTPAPRKMRETRVKPGLPFCFRQSITFWIWGRRLPCAGCTRVVGAADGAVDGGPDFLCAVGPTVGLGRRERGFPRAMMSSSYFRRLFRTKCIISTKATVFAAVISALWAPRITMTSMSAASLGRSSLLWRRRMAIRCSKYLVLIRVRVRSTSLLEFVECCGGAAGGAAPQLPSFISRFKLLPNIQIVLIEVL